MTASLPVNEIFETIQGEASHTGQPSVFVRLQGCPVGCAFCDTKFTWDVDPDHELPIVDDVVLKTKASSAWSKMSPERIVEIVRQFHARHVVITGGEPCLYDLCALTNAIHGAGRSAQIETSGTHPILVAPEAFVTISPKIGMPGGLSLLNTALARADEIKMPVGKRSDVNTLFDILARGVHRPGIPIYLQPLSLSKRATELCVEVATEYGYRVSVQVHALAGWR